MVIRKHGNNWQCIVRLKGISVAQSFISKADARKWENKQEAQIRLGTYSDDSKLTNLRLRDLLKLYFDKAVKVSCRPKLLKYEVDLLCRLPISSNTLTTLTAVKLANFRDERLKDGRSTTTVGKYLKLISRAIVFNEISSRSKAIQCFKKNLLILFKLILYLLIFEVLGVAIFIFFLIRPINLLSLKIIGL